MLVTLTLVVGITVVARGIINVVNIGLFFIFGHWIKKYRLSFLDSLHLSFLDSLHFSSDHIKIY